MSSSLLYYVEYIVYTETQIEQFNTRRRIVKPLGNAVHLVPDYAAALPQSLELLKLIFPATLLGFLDDSVLKNPPQKRVLLQSVLRSARASPRSCLLFQ